MFSIDRKFHTGRILVYEIPAPYSHSLLLNIARDIIELLFHQIT